MGFLYSHRCALHLGTVAPAGLTLPSTRKNFAAEADAPDVETHSISVFGDLALPANFPYFPHVNPESPKGGTFSRELFGTFNSLNGFILRGDPAVRRLKLHASIIQPITKRLLTEVGLTSSMSVLDLGSGRGDVAILAAEMVGPSSPSVGIDRSIGALNVSRELARQFRLINVEFRQRAAEDCSHAVPFDLVIGRYVLIHQPNPTAFIRAAAA